MIYSIWIILGRKSIPVHLPQDPPQSTPVSSKFWSLSKQCHAKKLFWNSMVQKNNVEFRIKYEFLSYFLYRFNYKLTDAGATCFWTPSTFVRAISKTIKSPFSETTTIFIIIEATYERTIFRILKVRSLDPILI